MAAESVADFVASRQPARQLGDPVTVSADLPECTDAGRALFVSVEVADANVDRCRAAGLSYEGGDTERLAYREGGTIRMPVTG